MDGIAGRLCTFNPPGWRCRSGYAHDFRGISADDIRFCMKQEFMNDFVPVGRRSCADRIQYDRNMAGMSGVCRQFHGFDPFRLQCSDIENQSIGDGCHFSHFFPCMGHNRCCTQSQQDVGVVAHHDEIGDVVDQRCFCPDLNDIVPEIFRECFWRSHLSGSCVECRVMR